MLDLSRIFFRKQEPKLPAVAAIAVADGDNAAAMIEAVKKAYEVVAEDKIEGATLLKLDASFDASAETSVVKMSDDLAAFMVNVEKSVDTYPQALSFMENMNASGFLPSVRLATDVATETILNIVLAPGETQETTVNKIDEVLKEYRAYVLKLTKAIPTSVFKMDSSEFTDSVKEIQKGLLIAPTEPQAEDATKTEETPAAAVEEAAAEPAAEAAAEPDAEPQADEGVAQDVQKSQADSQQELLEKISGLFGEKIETLKGELTETLNKMEARVNEMGETVTGLSGKVEAVEGIAKSADEAVRGTVHTGGEAPDTNGAKVVKQDRNNVFDGLLNFPGFEEV